MSFAEVCHVCKGKSMYVNIIKIKCLQDGRSLELKGKVVAEEVAKATGNETSLSRFCGFQCKMLPGTLLPIFGQHECHCGFAAWTFDCQMPIWCKFERTGMHIFMILCIHSLGCWYCCWARWGLQTDFMRVGDSVADSQLTPARSTTVSCGVHFRHNASGASSAGKAQNCLPGWWVQVQVHCVQSQREVLHSFVNGKEAQSEVFRSRLLSDEIQWTWIGSS